MKPHMDFETPFGSEHRIAHMAVEVLLARMSLQMTIKSGFHREALVALRTLERLLACVDSCMPNQVTWLLETLWTHFTRVWISWKPLEFFTFVLKTEKGMKLKGDNSYYYFKDILPS